jgi:hypothetical protein
VTKTLPILRPSGPICHPTNAPGFEQRLTLWRPGTPGPQTSAAARYAARFNFTKASSARRV